MALHRAFCPNGEKVRLQAPARLLLQISILNCHLQEHVLPLHTSSCAAVRHPQAGRLLAFPGGLHKLLAAGSANRSRMEAEARVSWLCLLGFTYHEEVLSLASCTALHLMAGPHRPAPVQAFEGLGIFSVVTSD